MVTSISNKGFMEAQPSKGSNPLSSGRRQIKEQLGALTETMSSGAPLTIWYNLSTKPEGVPFFPSPLEGTGLVDFGRVVVICWVRRGCTLWKIGDLFDSLHMFFEK